MAQMKKALEDVHILDLTIIEAGPACTELLAFLGADVIKIEAPTGDPGRKSAVTPNMDPEASANNWDGWSFIFLNANKRSITLNLKTAKGLYIFKEMVKKADVVVSNFSPGTMHKLGIDYDVLSKINPRLVYAENSGFGTGGPYSNYVAFDAIAKAAGGVFSNTGEPDGSPGNPGPHIGDTGSGVHMAVAVLAALHFSRVTGEGQAIDMSMTDNIINLNRSPLRYTMVTGKPIPRMGGSGLGGYPYDTFRCKGDGPNDYIFIGAVRDMHYANLMKTIGREDLASLDADARFDARAMLKPIIEAWTLTHDKMEAFRILAEAEVPVGPVLTSVEVLNDPHFIQRGIVRESVHPKRGKHKMIGCPVQLSKSPVEIRPAPLLGQHNEEVLREWMGYTPEEVAKLKEEKVI